MALILLGIIVTLLLHTLASHQKVFRELQERILVSGQLREGEQVLVADIRGAAIAGDTLRILADSAIELFSTIGSSVVCTVPAAQTVSLVPEGLASGLVLTALTVVPDSGDLFAVYPVPDSNANVRQWARFRIISVIAGPAVSHCPASTGFTMAADANLSAYRLTLSGSSSPTLTPGSPVRFIRRSRYSLYRSSDGQWYLGNKRCNAVATGCSTIQPVSGPYLPYSAETGGGLRFRYLDSIGVQIPSTRPLDAASIEITLRAQVVSAGQVSGRRTDSALLVVTPRNFR